MMNYTFLLHTEWRLLAIGLISKLFSSMQDMRMHSPTWIWQASRKCLTSFQMGLKCFIFVIVSFQMRIIYFLNEQMYNRADSE